MDLGARLINRIQQQQKALFTPNDNFHKRNKIVTGVIACAVVFALFINNYNGSPFITYVTDVIVPSILLIFSWYLIKNRRADKAMPYFFSIVIAVSAMLIIGATDNAGYANANILFFYIALMSIYNNTTVVAVSSFFGCSILAVSFILYRDTVYAGAENPALLTFMSMYFVTCILLTLVSKLGAEMVEEILVAEREANYDKLTGIPNRRAFLAKLEQVVSEENKSKTAIMMIDLDGFKAVNDTYGHMIGDELLIHVAHKLESIFRDTDFVGRLGGDEFVVIANIKRANDVEALGAKIRDAVNKPFDIMGNYCDIGASVGISIYPDHGVGVKAIVDNADKAMYAIKKGGKGNFRVFNPEEDGEIIQERRV